MASKRERERAHDMADTGGERLIDKEQAARYRQG